MRIRHRQADRSAKTSETRTEATRRAYSRSSTTPINAPLTTFLVGTGKRIAVAANTRLALAHLSCPDERRAIPITESSSERSTLAPSSARQLVLREPRWQLEIDRQRAIVCDLEHRGLFRRGRIWIPPGRVRRVTSRGIERAPIIVENSTCGRKRRRCRMQEEPRYRSRIHLCYQADRTLR